MEFSKKKRVLRKQTLFFCLTKKLIYGKISLEGGSVMIKIEKNLLEKLKEDKVARIFNTNNDFAFSKAEDLIQNMGEIFQKENLSVFSELNYLGFRFANGERQKRLESLYFKIYKSKYHIFEKEFETKKNILSFFEEMDSELLPDFYNIMKHIDKEVISKVNMKNLPKLNQKLFQLTKEKIESDFSEWKYGYYKNASFGVKRTYNIVYCNKEILEKNIIILCKFTQAYCHALLDDGKGFSILRKDFSENSFHSKSLFDLFYGENIPILLDICLEKFLKNKNLASDFIASIHDKNSIQKVLTETSLNQKDIIFDAIKKNTECYIYLPKEYQVDKEICLHVINIDFSNIYNVIKYGQISEEIWKNKIIHILEEENE